MKKIIYGILAGVIAIGGVVAAATLIEPEEAMKANANRVVYGDIDTKYKTSDWRTATDGEYLIGDFEDIFECGNMSFSSTVFGKLSIDNTLYKSGSSSLKIEVDGSGKLYADNLEFPSMRFLTVDASGKTEYSLAMLTNYSAYNTICFDMYNAQEEGFVFFFVNSESYAKPIKLQSGWNSVEISLTDNYIVSALADEDYDGVQSFGFSFDKYQKNSIKQIYYLDNFKVVQ